MKSAKKLMADITEIVCSSITHIGDEEYAKEADIKIEALIRARDREIVEACRKLLMDLHKAHGDLGTYDMNYVLDSVLRDLG